MPSSYATMGSAAGDVIGTLLGGGDYSKFTKQGSDAALNKVQAQKMSIESQQILDELQRDQDAASVTGRQIARARGINPALYDAYQTNIDNPGQYGSPVSEVGPVDVSRPPAGLTPEVSRQIQEADLLTALKTMSGGADSNTNTLMETLLGGQKYTLGGDTQTGTSSAADTANIMAAMEGKDLAADRKVDRERIYAPSDLDKEARAYARAKGVSVDQAYVDLGLAKRTTTSDRDAQTLSLNDVSSAVKLAVPELDAATYMTLDDAGRAAYMESLASQSKSPATVLNMIKSMLVPGVAAAPEVTGLIAALEKQVGKTGEITRNPQPPAIPPGWGAVIKR